MAFLNKNYAGTQIDNELHTDVGAGSFVLAHDTFFGGADLEIWTGVNKTGTKLVQGTHYLLENEDAELTVKCGKEVYTSITITSPTYQSGPLYITYKSPGDYVDASVVNTLIDSLSASPNSGYVAPKMLGVWPWLNSIRKRTTLTLPDGFNSPTCVVYDGRYIYVGLDTQPVKIVKILPSDMSVVETCTLQVGENQCRAITYDGTYIYVGLGLSVAKIVKIEPVTMTRVSSLSLSSGENDCRALVFDGTYLYAGLYTTPAQIVKINPVDMTKVGSALVLDSGENKCLSMTFDGNYIYVGLEVSPGKVVKVNPITLSRVSAVTFASGENNVRCLMFDGQYIYAGVVNKTKKINTAAMTATDIPGAAYSMTFDGEILYYSYNGTPGSVSKGGNTAVSLGPGETEPVAMTCDGHCIYICCSTTPGKIVQRDILSTI